MKTTASLVSRFALAIMLGAGACAAWAEDFEFEIPVQVSKMDSAFTQVAVHCSVFGVGRDPSGQITGGRTTLIGGGGASNPLVGGGFNGTLSVRFNANRPQHQPTDARIWNCGLEFAAPGGTVSACVMDVATGQTTGRVPAILGLDGKGGQKVCLFGMISGSPGQK